jgi:hypothetical protein
VLNLLARSHAVSFATVQVAVVPGRWLLVLQASQRQLHLLLHLLVVVVVVAALPCRWLLVLHASLRHLHLLLQTALAVVVVALGPQQSAHLTSWPPL